MMTREIKSRVAISQPKRPAQGNERIWFLIFSL
jgi:hypothetical protein